MGCAGPVSADAASSTILTRCPPGSIAISSAGCSPRSIGRRIWKTTPTQPPWANALPVRARHARRVVMLTFGTGVGGGAVILDGRVYRGTQGRASRVGSHSRRSAGPPATAARAVAWSRSLREPRLPRPGIGGTGRQSRGVLHRPREATRPPGRLSRAWGRALEIASWTILHTFMPELIVLGGGVMDEHYDAIAPAVADQMPLATMVPPGAAGSSRQRWAIGRAWSAPRAWHWCRRRLNRPQGEAAPINAQRVYVRAAAY